MNLSETDLPDLSPRRLHHGVHDMLRSRILDGTLSPGTRLRVNDLAAQLNISAMPVREAIRELEASGLVTSVPHRGAWVSRLDAGEIANLLELRLILEPEAARRAAPNIDYKRADMLHRHLKRLEQTARHRDRSAELLNSDEALQLAIFEACNNPDLVAEISRIWDRVRPYKLLHLKHGADAAGPPVVTWDSEIVKACIARDADAAAAKVREPLERTQRELVEFTRRLSAREAEMQGSRSAGGQR